MGSVEGGGALLQGEAMVSGLFDVILLCRSYDINDKVEQSGTYSFRLEQCTTTYQRILENDVCMSGVSGVCIGVVGYVFEIPYDYLHFRCQQFLNGIACQSMVLLQVCYI